MAGLGESRSDTGALLIKLEAPVAVRAGFTKKACTDDKIANIKIYTQKAIDNSKKSEPKTISFSGTNTKPRKMKILTCFCSDYQRFNLNQLYYILIQNIKALLFQSLNLPREHESQT